MIRRQFLVGLLLGLAGPFSFAMRLERDSFDRPTADRLLRITGCGPSSAVVGRCYLQSYPDERSVTRLVNQLTADLDLSQSRAPAEIRAAISVRVRRDFVEGRTVAVHGWILSRTEARVSALAAVSGLGPL